MTEIHTDHCYHNYEKTTPQGREYCSKCGKIKERQQRNMETHPWE